MKTRHTRILPMPVWAEISSPAQSLASDRKSPSGASSGFCPWSLNFLASSFSLCFSSSLKGSTSFYEDSICWRENISHNTLTCVHKYCWANLVTMTDIKPRRKVKIDERRKHHHFLSLRHSSYSIRGMPLKRKKSDNIWVIRSYFRSKSLNVITHLHLGSIIYFIGTS